MDESMENTRVFGYVRVSTAGQVKEGYSLEQQKEEIVNFCVENNYDLIKMYGTRVSSAQKWTRMI